ncbi:hypothetical protein MCC02031_07200 [Bifidobacteriaceae bacterium MCC02031]|nr:hypothetical protein MCC02031_07200 [Bifidobacteriaceae bacterium MCC02031]
MITSTICWHCHCLAQMVEPDEPLNDAYPSMVNGRMASFPDFRFDKSSKDEDTRFRLVVCSCVACGYPNLAEVRTRICNVFDGSEPAEPIVRWLPIEPIGKEYRGVPDNIASIASEAHKCFQIGAYRAAVALSRSTLDGIVRNLDASLENKKLYEGLKILADKGKLKQRTSEAATAIRLSGNVSVHDSTAEIEPKFAEIVLKILDAVIEDLYSQPSLVDEAKRYATKAKEREHNEQY